MALDSGHTTWVLVSSALVLFMMIPGLALFYAGLVRTKNVLSVLMQCMALTAVLRRMKRNGITVHGFRSTFRDWAAEKTNYPREMCEFALAHTLPSEVEAAYWRSDMLEKRRQLMKDWAKYCDTPKPAGNVLPMRRKGRQQ